LISLVSIGWQVFKRKFPPFEFFVFWVIFVLFIVVRVRNFLAILN
jgi:hypothetical protein